MADKSAKAPEHPASLHVWALVPSKDRPLDSVPGISPDGTDAPWEEAQAWLAAGLVTDQPPDKE
jgi:hypothetical protein